MDHIRPLSCSLSVMTNLGLRMYDSKFHYLFLAVMDWFDSYLADQTQIFQCEGQRSEPFRVYCSVPQGSVLGPEEFTSYTEDLDDLISRHHPSRHLYADDTQLIDGFRIVEISVTIERLQQCVEEIHRWCASRRLQLNPSKT